MSRGHVQTASHPSGHFARENGHVWTSSTQRRLKYSVKAGGEGFSRPEIMLHRVCIEIAAINQCLMPLRLGNGVPASAPRPSRWPICRWARNLSSGSYRYGWFGRGRSPIIFCALGMYDHAANSLPALARKPDYTGKFGIRRIKPRVPLSCLPLKKLRVRISMRCFSSAAGSFRITRNSIFRSAWDRDSRSPAQGGDHASPESVEGRLKVPSTTSTKFLSSRRTRRLVCAEAKFSRASGSDFKRAR